MRYPSQTSARNPRSGFTLLEVIVVLFIVSILALTISSYFGGRQASAVKGATAELTSALNAARNLARNSGRRVFLQTTGGGATAAKLEWGFVDDGTIQGTWTQEPRLFAASSIGIGTTDIGLVNPNPDPRTAVPAIQNMISAGGWATSFFTGGTSRVISFDLTGASSADFFISVAGRTNGTVKSAGNPIAVITVSATNGLRAFYKPSGPDATSSWQRL